MNNSKRENLTEILAKFMDEGQARQTAEDIEKGEKLLDAYPAPGPDERVLTEIKHKLASTVRQRRLITFQHRILAAAAVAAIIVLGVALSLRLPENETTSPAPTGQKTAAAISSGFWENSDITKDDSDITVLSAEVETIENSLAKMQADETGSNGNGAAGDLEMELIEVSSDFWKG